jgi:hypothetical protein
MERRKLMRLFRRKGHAVKNWHSRALIIDPKKTRLTLITKKATKQVPEWIYKKYVQQQLSSN